MVPKPHQDLLGVPKLQDPRALSRGHAYGALAVPNARLFQGGCRPLDLRSGDLFPSVRNEGLASPVAHFSPVKETVFGELDRYLGLPRIATCNFGAPDRLSSLMHWRTLQRLLMRASARGSDVGGYSSPQV